MRGLFSVKLRGVQEVTRTIDRVGVETEETVKAILAKGAVDLQREIKAEIKRQHAIDTGNLWQSVQIKTEAGGLVKKIVEQASYGVYVERGTKPHFPPVEALEDWARHHNLNPWAVAVAISRRGTRAKPHFIPAARRVLPEIIRRLERALR